MSRYLIPNKPHVASEQFDNEVILVSLVNGNYYSLRNCAAEIWNGLENGYAVEQVVSGMRDQFQLDEESTSTITAFVDELLEHELVRPVENAVPAEKSFASAEETFTSPILEAYSDMQDILLLDPIHDVDEESGWPARPAPEEGS